MRNNEIFRQEFNQKLDEIKYEKNIIEKGNLIEQTIDELFALHLEISELDFNYCANEIVFLFFKFRDELIKDYVEIKKKLIPFYN